MERGESLDKAHALLLAHYGRSKKKMALVDVILLLLRINSVESIDLVQNILGKRITFCPPCGQKLVDFSAHDYINQLAQ